jgi:hypothetical protein
LNSVSEKRLCTDTSTAGLPRTSIILVLTVKTGNCSKRNHRTIVEWFFAATYSRRLAQKSGDEYRPGCREAAVVFQDDERLREAEGSEKLRQMEEFQLGKGAQMELLVRD